MKVRPPGAGVPRGTADRRSGAAGPRLAAAGSSPPNAASSFKARVVQHRGRAFRSAPLSAHIAYLERDGVTRGGEKAHVFSATEDRADAMAFAGRGVDDRHHFRFVVAPEDAAEMTDLKAFTRDLAAQMKSDLGTPFDWVGIAHWNTDNPHVHLVVRGVADDGSDLVISRDYISHGLRSRAEDLVSAELGPKPEYEIHSALDREVDGTSGSPAPCWSGRRSMKPVSSAAILIATSRRVQRSAWPLSPSETQTRTY
jgi:hypothetical protein